MLGKFVDPCVTVMWDAMMEAWGSRETSVHCMASHLRQTVTIIVTTVRT
jgi:hypothetical protein